MTTLNLRQEIATLPKNEGDSFVAVKVRYEVAALPETEGGGFVAAAVDMPGCMSDGATIGEAVDNLQDAAVCWLEEAQAMGRPVPLEVHQHA